MDRQQLRWDGAIRFQHRSGTVAGVIVLGQGADLLPEIGDPVPVDSKASCQLIEKSAIKVVTTVAVLLTILARVPLITVLTPLISVFIRVIISPCFSVVKNE